MPSYIQYTQPNPTNTYASVDLFAAAITAFKGASADMITFEEAVRKAQPGGDNIAKPNYKLLREWQKKMYGDFETPTGASNTTYRDMFCEETGLRLCVVDESWFNANIAS